MRGVDPPARLDLVPPLAELDAASAPVERDEEDPLVADVDAARDRAVRHPPARDAASVGRNREWLVRETHVLLAGDRGRPPVADLRPAAQGSVERSPPVARGVRKEPGGGVGIATLPGVSVPLEPGRELLECLVRGVR
jgi:hypothetical protein